MVLLQMRSATETSLTMVVEGVDAAFMNALRRTLLSDVPKLAIDEVTVYDNTSALFDETLGHRLGLLPIPTDLAILNFRESCTCKGEGCPSCTVLYTLSKEGPCTVYSGDLSPTDRKWAVRDDRIPLVKLLPGQRVMLEATAVLGTAQTHAKWQVASAVGYRNYPEIELLSPECPEGGACARLAPHVFGYENEKVVLKNAEAYKFAPDTLDACKDHLRVKLRDDKWLLLVETDGSLSAREAIVRAVGLLKEKLKATETAAPDLAAAPAAAK
ncbi:MAG TPA: DNA-directed RNA polymerase subunit D [Candidatus Thermoplasmatota archaeon]|nr:DNA-directed RNA polymerase subunit D [Candidatus Thermoplasmatota archaeon]